MAVSRDRSQHFRRSFEQKAVQVVAHVLLRHREMGLVEQPLEILLGSCRVCSALISSTTGNSAAGSVDSVKRLLRARTSIRSPSEVQRDLDGAFRQRAADIEQLAAGDA
jgi:hypothetical protein